MISDERPCCSKQDGRGGGKANQVKTQCFSILNKYVRIEISEKTLIFNVVAEH